MRYTAFVLGVVILTSRLGAQAQLQLIHTVVDMVGVSNPHVLDSVDIYISSDAGNNWTLFANDLKFRGATPYLPVPAGVQLTVGIAPGNASGPSPILYTALLAPLTNGTHNIGFLTGRLSPSLSLEVTLFPNARATAQNPTQFDFTVFHAISNAGGASVYLFSAYTPDYIVFYRSSPPSYSTIGGSILLVLGDGGNFNTIYSPGYLIPDPQAIGAVGQAGIVFLSGLVDTINPLIEMALHLALPDGRVFPLAPQEVRRIQYIHNAADPQLGQIDLHPVTFPSGAKVSLDFRQAAPVYFLTGLSGSPIRFYIAPRGNTISVLDSIDLIIPPPGSAVAVVQGVLNPSLYAPNPNGTSTRARFFTISGLPLFAPPGQLALAALHGITDAPTVSIVIQGATTLSNLPYGGHSASNLLIANRDYEVELRQASNNQLIGRFRLAAAQAVGGNAALLVVSGFNNPAVNQNGPALGLYVIYPLGQVEPLASITGLSHSVSGLLQVEPWVNDEGNWVVSLEAARTTSLTYQVRDALGRSLLEGTWEIPSAGSWIYTLPAQTLPAGLYLLQVGEKSFRLLR